MSVFQWSQTAASNGAADPTCPFPEGMAPSAVNDSVRGAMAAVAKYRDDIAGAIVTAGTNVAYTISTFSGFDTFAHMSGQLVAFSPHATNGAGPVTINIDGLGAKPLRTSPGVELLAGMIIQGTPYAAVYNNTDGAVYLEGFYGNPYSVPLFGGMDFWDTIAPNSSFIFPAGQAISRATYATAFARWGTTYGVGDGSTTFNVPDKTGRVSAMKEGAASRLTATYFGGNSANMGAVGGIESNNVLLTHNHTLTDPGHQHTVATNSGSTTGTSSQQPVATGSGVPTSPAFTGITIAQAGSASAHNIVQPTIVCNYIIRII